MSQDGGFMANNKSMFYGWVVSILFALSACTNSAGDGDISNTDVLASQSVFASDSLTASFQNASGVSGFDDNNRPIMDGESSCPDVTPDPDDDNDTPPPPPTCDAGFEYNGEKCVSICQDNQIFAQDQCYDKEKSCDIANGSGTQQWLANTYGACTPTKCNDGYKIDGEKCIAKCSDDEVYHNGKCKPLVADCRKNKRDGVKLWNDTGYGKCQISKDCKIKNGQGLSPFDLKTKKHKRCEVASCKKGFKANKKNNKCVSICSKEEVFNGKKCLPLTRSCRIAGGKGERTWNHKRKRYGWCKVTSCNPGFNRAGNSCRRPGRDRDNADPLIVDLGADMTNAQGISLTSQIEGILFDILGLNSTPNPNDKKQISWTQQQRYQWVVKPDANGQVLGIDQMFGDNTMGPDGKFSAEGFEALGKYDADKNGIIDSEDPVFNELFLWHDANGNGTSDVGELTSFSAADIASIDLKFDPNFFEVDQYGNKTTYKSVVKFNDGRRTLIFDLWFKFMDPPDNNPPTDPKECPVPDTDDNN